MSKLTDEQMRDVLKNTNHMVRNSMYGAFWPELEQACRAIEVAATEPLLQRIAELEQRNSDLHEDVQRFKQHALNEKAARLELERQLEEARNQALEEAAKVCENMQQGWPSDDQLKCADAIRALKGAKE